MRKLVIWAILVLFFPIQVYGLNNEQIKKSYYQSYNYEKMGNYKDAIRALSPVYNAYPKGYTVNLRLGWLYYLDKNYANSIGHYQTARKVVPGAIEPLLGMSLPLMAQQKWTKVEKLMYEVVKKDYYNYYGNLRLSIALRMEKKYNLAEKMIRKMLSLYPTDVNFLVELGMILKAKAQTKEATAVFTSVLILDPQNVVAKEYFQDQKKLGKKPPLENDVPTKKHKGFSIFNFFKGGSYGGVHR